MEATREPETAWVGLRAGAVETLVSKVYGDGEHGPSVIVAHHVPKAAKGGTGKDPTAALTARGVSGLTDGVRWEASLTVKREWKKKGGEFPLRVLGFAVTKSNYAVRYDEETLLEMRAGDDGATPSPA